MRDVTFEEGKAEDPEVQGVQGDSSEWVGGFAPAPRRDERARAGAGKPMVLCTAGPGVDIAHTVWPVL